MQAIKTEILAYVNRAGKGEDKEVSLVALDRYLVYVKHEEHFVGGNLLNVIQELTEENLLKRTSGSNICLTEQSQQIISTIA